MIPFNYYSVLGIVKFLYNPKDLKEFHKRGSEYGDNGWILIEREGLKLKYIGYGTIEHPCKDLITFELIHNHIFDGIMPSDDERLRVPTFDDINMSYSFIILDTNNEKPNIQKI